MIGKDGEKAHNKKNFNNKSVFSDKILKIKLCGLDALSWSSLYIQYYVIQLAWLTYSLKRNS